jgi:guanylate kinase
MREPRGLLIVLSGPSGVGKDTVLAQVLNRLDCIRRSVSATTRPPAPGERDGVDYHFVSETEFDRLIETDALLEWAVVHGHRYGTPRKWIEEQLQKGIDVVLEIDVQGAFQVRERFPDAVLIFLEPPSMEALTERLRQRGRESEEEIRSRLQTAEQELAVADRYDHRLVNDDLTTCVESLTSLIESIRAGKKVART